MHQFKQESFFSLENMNLISPANQVFRKRPHVMQPFEFAVNFNSIKPVLRDRLEKANQKECFPVFRDMVHYTLTELISALKAQPSDELLFLPGLKQEYQQYRHGDAAHGFGKLALQF